MRPLEAITDVAALDALYGAPAPAAILKVANRLTPQYRRYIEAARFAALATVGPEGVDVSPRGDAGPVLTILDDKTLALPDRRGNNRTDSLSNIVRDPRVALMLMIPGSDTIIRINGSALVTADPELCDRLAVDGKPPRTVTIVTIAEIYFQCARAILRAGLWTAGAPPALPTVGEILATMSEGSVGGPEYDAAWPARARKSMW